MNEISLPIGPAGLLQYFDAVARETDDPHFRKGAAMCRQWLRLISGPVTQREVDEFIDELETEQDPGSGWVDLGMQFRAWARDQGLKVGGSTES